MYTFNTVNFHSSLNNEKRDLNNTVNIRNSNNSKKKNIPININIVNQEKKILLERKIRKGNRNIIINGDYYYESFKNHFDSLYSRFIESSKMTLVVDRHSHSHHSCNYDNVGKFNILTPSSPNIITNKGIDIINNVKNGNDNIVTVKESNFNNGTCETIIPRHELRRRSKNKNEIKNNGNSNSDNNQKNIINSRPTTLANRHYKIFDISYK